MPWCGIFFQKYGFFLNKSIVFLKILACYSLHYSRSRCTKQNASNCFWKFLFSLLLLPLRTNKLPGYLACANSIGNLEDMISRPSRDHHNVSQGFYSPFRASTGLRFAATKVCPEMTIKTITNEDAEAMIKNRGDKPIR